MPRFRFLFLVLSVPIGQSGIITNGEKLTSIFIQRTWARSATEFKALTKENLVEELQKDRFILYSCFCRRLYTMSSDHKVKTHCGFHEASEAESNWTLKTRKDVQWTLHLLNYFSLYKFSRIKPIFKFFLQELSPRSAFLKSPLTISPVGTTKIHSSCRKCYRCAV